MKSGLAIGATHEETMVVDSSMQAKVPMVFGGHSIHPVLGTAALIESLEWTSRQLILPYLETDEEGVGASVELRHLASVPIGESVRLESSVVEVSERRVKTKIQAWHEQTLVADGSFVQAVVPLALLYPESFECSPAISENLPNEPVSTMDVATLTSKDQKYQFSLELLAWESKFPCTPYDEWIHCRLTLQSPLGLQQVEGPHLLHFEIEGICDALERVKVNGVQTGFQSDFLEKMLQLGMHSNASGQAILNVQLQQLGQKILDEQLEPIIFPVDIASITPWCQVMRKRLMELQAQL